jgi:hypothetical protein
MEEDLKITSSIKRNLLLALRWLKFITAIATVAVALLFILGLASMALGEQVDSFGMVGVTVGFFFLILSLLYVYPIKKCYDLIAHSKHALKQGAQMSLEASSKDLKRLLKYISIIIIISVVIFILVIVIGGAGAAFKATMP